MTIDTTNLSEELIKAIETMQSRFPELSDEKILKMYDLPLERRSTNNDN